MNIQKVEPYETVIRFDVLTNGEPYTAELVENETLGYVDVTVYDFYGQKIIDEQIIDNISEYIFQNFNI